MSKSKKKRKNLSDKIKRTYMLENLPRFPENLVMTPPECLDYDICWQDMING